MNKKNISKLETYWSLIKKNIVLKIHKLIRVIGLFPSAILFWAVFNPETLSIDRRNVLTINKFTCKDILAHSSIYYPPVRSSKLKYTSNRCSMWSSKVSELYSIAFCNIRSVEITKSRVLASIKILQKRMFAKYWMSRLVAM